MSRRRFVERSLVAVLGTALVGETACGRPIVRRDAERTGEEDGNRRRHGAGRGFGLRRLLRRLLRG
jgi:hypothetical protein